MQSWGVVVIVDVSDYFLVFFVVIFFCSFSQPPLQEKKTGRRLTGRTEMEGCEGREGEGWVRGWVMKGDEEGGGGG